MLLPIAASWTNTAWFTSGTWATSPGIPGWPFSASSTMARTHAPSSLRAVFERAACHLSSSAGVSRTDPVRVR
ncbi:hypothetical protein GCM10009665_79550 [Kitasatospora nipponensis]|uniref:Secreted protein n=1 Tax=Kitasatospora nipponensis TaxID=258049 RepID=A0ABN1TEW1_9ACTN